MTYPTKKLGEVTDVIGGGTPSTNIIDYWGDDYFWVTPKDLGNINTIEITQTGRKISKAGLKNSSAQILPVGSVILSSRAPIGYVVINSVEMATNQGCRSFICSSKIYNRFLYYFLEANTDYLNSLGSGNTFKEVSGSRLKEIKIPLPPLEIQKKIVRKIEKLFAKIDEAQKLREEAKKDTDTLLQSTMNEIFSSVESKKWSRKKLNEICIKITDGSHLPPQEVENGEMMLSSRNIYDDGINFQRYRKISKTDFEEENKRTNISPGDILFTCVGSIGRCLVVPPNAPKFTLQRSVAVIKPKDELNSKYLAYCLKSPSIQERVFQKSRGAAQQGIYLKDIKNLEIQLPTLKIQKQIVARLDKLTEKVRELQKLQSETAADLTNLKQSILAKAFKGEL